MNLLDKIKYVEIHPLKISIDVLSDIVAVGLFWKNYLLSGLAIAYLPSMLAAVFIMKYLDLEKYKNSKAGKYILKYKNLSADLSAIIGEIIIWIGAWNQSVYIIILGLLIFITSYCHGVFKN